MNFQEMKKLIFDIINYKSNEQIEFYLSTKSLEIILQINQFFYANQKNKFK